MDGGCETVMTWDPVCPYCGYEDPDGWELREPAGEAECLNCGREYSYTIEHIYTTSKIEGDD